MKNNKGITLITVIISIVVIIIITAVTINISSNVSELVQYEEVETNLMLIQSKIKILSDKKAIGEITDAELYGVPQGSGDYAGWYLLTQEELDNMKLDKLFAEDSYYVNYEDNDVAFGDGIEYKGVTYYKLSEMKEF